MNWNKGKLPKKPGMYLCTFYDNSALDYYVTPCEFMCKPYQAFTKFVNNKKEDVTHEVIAWMLFPEPYRR